MAAGGGGGGAVDDDLPQISATSQGQEWNKGSFEGDCHSVLVNMLHS